MDKESSVYDKDDLNQMLDRINLWIENSDTKTSIVIGAVGVVLAILLSSDYVVKCKGIIKNMTDNMSVFSFIYLAIFCLSIAVIIYGCYCLFKGLVPRIDMNLYKENGIEAHSLIFFSTIASNRSYNDYKERVEKGTDIEQRNDLTSQIYICSKICQQKFTSYKKGITFVLLGMLIFTATIIIGLMIT